MKITKLLLSICILGLCTSPTFADEQSHRKLAEEYMVLTEVEQMMEQPFKNLKEGQLKKVEEFSYPGKNPEKDKILHDRLQSYMDKKLVWSNFKQAYADVYINVFSEDELKALVQFYSSPVGKKVQKNGLELRRKVLEASQMQMKDFGLQIKKIQRDFLDEQKPDEQKK